MAAAVEADDLLDVLTCPVCRQVFCDPVHLECGHNFCRACINGAWGSGRPASCPKCQWVCPERRLTPSRVLANLVELVREPPRRVSEEPRSQVRCAEHEEKLRLFCRNDGDLACVVCRDALKHSGHSFLPLQDADRELRSKLTDIKTPLESTLRELSDLITGQEQKLSGHQVNRLHLEHHIIFEFEKLHKFLNAQEKTLLQELKSQGEALKKDMEENLRKLKEEHQRIQEEISKNQAKMDQQDPLIFLKGIKVFLERSSDQQRKIVSAQNMVLAQELCCGQFKGPLQYMVWKEMRSHVTPALACITLDPSSAHPNLVLSDDMTRLSYSTKTQRRPDNPERFSDCLIALGSDGFTSGRHYWEVTVGKKPDWYVGVAKESVNRKQRGDFSAKDGYWALCMANEKELMIFDRPPRPLPRMAIPHRISVYLDYEGGQLSFYNAKGMVHLHTFTDTFTEKLYPYFCPGNSMSGNQAEPLTIFHSQI